MWQVSRPITLKNKKGFKGSKKNNHKEQQLRRQAILILMKRKINNGI